MRTEVTYHTFVELRKISSDLLSVGAGMEDNESLLQATVIYSAFCFEAYLNHVGEQEVVFWEEIEMIRTFEKLTILKKHLSLEINEGCRPFQSLKEAFGIRNELAHGRTKGKDLDGMHHETILEELKDSFKRTKVNMEFAARCYMDTVELIENINSQRPNPEEYLWGLSFTKVGAIPVEPA